MSKKIYISLSIIGFFVLGGIIALVILIQSTDVKTKIILADKSINDQAMQIRQDSTLTELNIWKYVQFPDEARLTAFYNQRDVTIKDIDNLKLLTEKYDAINYSSISDDINNLTSGFSSINDSTQLIINAASNYLTAKTDDAKLQEAVSLRGLVLVEEKKYNALGFDSKVENLIKKENARINKDINDRQNYITASVWISFSLAILYLLLLVGISFWLNNIITLIKNKSH